MAEARLLRDYKTIPADVLVPQTGNNVCVFAEDMRYPKSNVILGPWGDPIGEEKTFPIVWQAHNSNLIVDWGRKMLLWCPLGLGSGSVLAGSVGDDGSSPTDNTLNRLKSELIGGSARPGLTNAAGAALSTGDVTAETSGSNFWKVIVSFLYDTTDANNGQTFAEFGMHNTVTLPAGTPPHTTSTSGNMFARFVPSGGSFPKTSAFRVTVLWTLRA
jgi:hypothetical protein